MTEQSWTCEAKKYVCDHDCADQCKKLKPKSKEELIESITKEQFYLENPDGNWESYKKYCPDHYEKDIAENTQEVNYYLSHGLVLGSQFEEVEKRVGEIEQVLRADATDLWRVTSDIRKEISSRRWLEENPDKEEIGILFSDIEKLIDQVQSPAQKRFYDLAIPQFEEAKNPFSKKIDFRNENGCPEETINHNWEVWEAQGKLYRKVE